ncbi:hypothetical protein LJC04_01230 [Ruminococcaceae bacterium OttesenSCG-928-O06]|nr:hypothetical protein [Ruminococcaceae bacterium OttesenSCG-928-O06]
MKLRYEKNVRVLTDIMGYCHLVGGTSFQIDFTMKEEVSDITIKTKIPGLPAENLHEIDKMLNIPRQREVEQYYWNISGGEEIDNELGLAGMMVDEAFVSYENDILTIKACRYDAPSPDFL